MDRKDKHQLLMEAYIDADFQKELKGIRDKIRNDFEEFAKTYSGNVMLSYGLRGYETCI